MAFLEVEKKKRAVSFCDQKSEKKRIGFRLISERREIEEKGKEVNSFKKKQRREKRLVLKVV